MELVLWGGLLLRDHRMRALISLRPLATSRAPEPGATWRAIARCDPTSARQTALERRILAAAPRGTSRCGPIRSCPT